MDHEESEVEDNLKKSDDFKKIRKLTKLLTAVKSKNHGKSKRRKSLTEPVGRNYLIVNMFRVEGKSYSYIYY